ncbi:hypothetical protein G7085_07630 [Tessaracoccus sp. HDW20]|uniref:hypothetical protein n=1 Tax=Tessaracoccus coleopterorum TaxID=2714950 RepID=UPI0018D276C0|nr:hypothetical protein [Tessaracoccus coleopterorum]NHB84519.1 hypothetical protein [Tessaracoccus coleopterorum]
MLEQGVGHHVSHVVTNGDDHFIGGVAWTVLEDGIGRVERTAGDGAALADAGGGPGDAVHQFGPGAGDPYLHALDAHGQPMEGRPRRDREVAVLALLLRGSSHDAVAALQHTRAGDVRRQHEGIATLDEPVDGRAVERGDGAGDGEAVVGGVVDVPGQRQDPGDLAGAAENPSRSVTSSEPSAFTSMATSRVSAAVSALAVGAPTTSRAAATSAVHRSRRLMDPPRVLSVTVGGSTRRRWPPRPHPGR